MLCSISPNDMSQIINNLNLCKVNSYTTELTEAEKKRIQQIQKQRERSYAYYLKIRELPGYKEKNILAKQQFYEKHQIRIRETERLKYKDNPEYREQKHNTARLKYLEKTEYTPKQKRGRKPLFIDESPTDDEIVTIDETETPLPKIKRGRKPKVNDDTDSALPKIKIVIKKKLLLIHQKTLPISYLVET